MTSSSSGSARTVLVCGAAGLLGSQICRTLAAEGHGLIVHTRRNAEGLQRLQEQLGDSVVGTEVADLADPACVAEMFERLAAHDRVPDMLVVSMYAPFEPRPVVHEPPEVIRRHLDAFLAHYLICQGFLRARQGRPGGSVVLVTGALSDRLFPGFSLVSAIKSALTTFASVLALEAGPGGTTVNCVSPGRIVSPDASDILPDGAEGSDDPRLRLAAMSRKRMALTSFPSALDVADLVSFLMSPSARQVTGQTIFLAAGEPM